MSPTHIRIPTHIRTDGHQSKNLSVGKSCFFEIFSCVSITFENVVEQNLGHHFFEKAQFCMCRVFSHFLPDQAARCGNPETGNVLNFLPEFGGHMSLFSTVFRFPSHTLVVELKASGNMRFGECPLN